MKIIEPTTDESKEVTINLNIPYTIYLHGERPTAEYSEIAVTTLTNEAETIFSHIETIAFDLENKEIPAVSAADILGTLSRIGAGLMGAIEHVQIVDRQSKKPVKSDSVLDLSQMSAEQLGTSDAAKCIFDFIHQPNIPPKVYEAFYDLFGNLLKSLPSDYQSRISVSEQSPDYIAEVLKGSLENGGGAQ